MSILETCQWLQDMPWATALRESQYMFPILEGTHLLGIALMMGPVLMFDLRLMGVLWKTEPAAKIRDAFLPITFVGFSIMIATGGVLFWSEAVRCYKSKYFLIKIALLVLAGLNALVFHRTVDRTIHIWGGDPMPPSRAKLAGASSLVLWLFVIAAGRYTAYNL
jgi:hypothetical protein